MADADNRQLKKTGPQKPLTPLFFGVCTILICVSAAYISCQPVPKGALDSPTTINPLSAAEASSASDTITGIGRIESAIIELKGLGIAPAITDSTEQSIKNTLSTGANCQLTYSRPPNTLGPREYFLSVAGQNCAITANYSAKYLAGAPTGKYLLAAQFQISDTTLRQNNDVTAMSLTGTGTHTFSNSGGFVQTEIAGEIQSQTKGTIKISISTQQTSKFTTVGTTTTGTRLIRLSFPASQTNKTAFTAEIKADYGVNQNQDNSRYTINGIDISKAEFESDLQKLGLLTL